VCRVAVDERELVDPGMACCVAGFRNVVGLPTPGHRRDAVTGIPGNDELDGCAMHPEMQV